MLDPLNAEELRLWAAQCTEKAERVISPRAERERLLKIRDALLALADSADWLSGRSRDLALQDAAE
jgi:hypothetical protein